MNVDKFYSRIPFIIKYLDGEDFFLPEDWFLSAYTHKYCNSLQLRYKINILFNEHHITNDIYTTIEISNDFNHITSNIDNKYDMIKNEIQKNNFMQIIDFLKKCKIHENLKTIIDNFEYVQKIIRKTLNIHLFFNINKNNELLISYTTIVNNISDIPKNIFICSFDKLDFTISDVKILNTYINDLYVHDGLYDIIKILIDNKKHIIDLLQNKSADMLSTIIDI